MWKIQLYDHPEVKWFNIISSRNIIRLRSRVNSHGLECEHLTSAPHIYIKASFTDSFYLHYTFLFFSEVFNETLIASPVILQKIQIWIIFPKSFRGKHDYSLPRYIQPSNLNNKIKLFPNYVTKCKFVLIIKFTRQNLKTIFSYFLQPYFSHIFHFKF